MESVLKIVDEPLKRVSALSSNPADKVRLTIATLMSFRNNLINGKIPKSVEIYNKSYERLSLALQQEEAEKALNEVQKSIGVIEEKPTVSKEESQILKTTSEWVLKDKFDALKLEIGIYPKGRFKTGTNEQYAPKRIKVEAIQRKIFSEIGKKGRENFVKKVVVQEPIKVPTENIPNWKQLFSNAEEVDLSTLMIENIKPKQESIVAKEDVVSPEMLKRRIMIGKIYDELLKVRSRMKNKVGVASIFERGLQERETQLIKMLSDVSGVLFPQINDKELDYQNTEIQDIIEDVVGFVEPMTEEERRDKEKQMEEYYANPEVGLTIEKLLHKDVLYSFNNPAIYSSVMEAERKHNESLSQTEIAKRIERKYESLNSEELQNAGKEQAKILFDVNQYDEFIKKGAEEQAHMLKTLSDFVEKQRIEEKKKLIEDASKQAKILYENNVLIDGASKQAEILLNKYLSEEKRSKEENERIQMLLKGAEYQAAELHLRNNIIDSAIVEAEIINSNNKLIDGAEEEAKRIYEHEKLIEGAEDQAALIISSEKILEKQQLFNEEVVRTIVYKNAKEEKIEPVKVIENTMLEQAEEQARIIFDRNQKIEIEEGALEEARNLFEKQRENVTSVVEKSKQNNSLGERVEVTILNSSYPLQTGLPKPIKLSRGQYNNLSNESQKHNQTGKPSYKQVLESMKEDLTNLDFLRYSDDVVAKKMVA